MYRAIIFDVDGTILDTEKAILQSLQYLLRHDYGREYKEEELYLALGIPGEDFLPQLGVINVAEANEKWNRYYQQFQHTVNVFDGVREVMKALAGKGIRMGIVTSKTRQELQAHVTPFSLLEYVEAAVCADDTVLHKPNPEPLLHFLATAGINGEEALYIGDTDYDRKCAEGAGVDFGLALWGCKVAGLTSRHRLEKPRDILSLVAL